MEQKFRCGYLVLQVLQLNIKDSDEVHNGYGAKGKAWRVEWKHETDHGWMS